MIEVTMGQLLMIGAITLSANIIMIQWEQGYYKE